MDFEVDFDDIQDIGEGAYLSDEENRDCHGDLDPVDAWNKEFEDEGIL